MEIKRMIAIIQIYIMHMKGVEVQISPNLPKDMPKLILAFTVAENWVSKNVTIN